MQSWSNFFFLCGSSAASLTGLMFIAITFGSRLITKDKLHYAEAFFSPICYHFIHVFVLCCAALAPAAGPRMLGAIIIASVLWRCVQLLPMIRVTRIASRDHGEVDASDWILGIVLPAACYAGLLCAGVANLAGSPHGTTILAASLVALLLIAIQRAWDMLLWTATKVD